MKIQGSGLRAEGLGFQVEGLGSGLREQSHFVGCRLRGLNFRMRFRVEWLPATQKTVVLPQEHLVQCRAVRNEGERFRVLGLVFRAEGFGWRN